MHKFSWMMLAVVMVIGSSAWAIPVLKLQYKADGSTPPADPTTFDADVQNPGSQPWAFSKENPTFVTTNPITNDGGFNAWEMIDDDNPSPEDGRYRFGSLTVAQLAQAQGEGFILNWRVRLVGNTSAGQNRSISLEVRLLAGSSGPGFRFNPRVTRNGSELFVELPTSGVDFISVSPVGEDADAYNDYSLVFKGDTDFASIFFNDTLIWTGLFSLADPGAAEVSFGSRAANNTGTGRWNSVEFFIGVPEPMSAMLIGPAMMLLASRRRQAAWAK